MIAFEPNQDVINGHVHDQRIDAIWCELTDHANRIFIEGQFQRANLLYQAALREAEAMCEMARSDNQIDHCDRAVAMRVVTTLNIAENHRAQKNLDVMESALLDCANWMISTLTDPSKSVTLRNAVAAQTSSLMTEYKRLITESGQETRQFQNLFAATQQATLEHLKTSSEPN